MILFSCPSDMLHKWRIINNLLFFGDRFYTHNCMLGITEFGAVSEIIIMS